MLEIDHLRVEYTTSGTPFVAVHDESFTVAAGEFFTLLGPSGCGKTTTLRSVAGLETPTGGRISIDGVPVFDATTGRVQPTHSREISMVFQSYAIWPHMTVFENVAYPLRVKRLARDEIKHRTEAVLEMVGLARFAQRSATQLSGGQQQRVALARAIVKDAKVLLLDEPLSNLDAKLREQMRRELRRLQKQVGTTSIYVTHDQDEALALSDRIAVMSDGRVVELGKPVDLYMRPRHPFTARFVGQADLVACKVLETSEGAVLLETPMGRLRAEENADLGRRTTHVMVRPEHVQFVDTPDQPNTLTGRISNMVFTGKLVEYDIEVPGGTIAVYSPSNILRSEGDEVHVHMPPARCVALSEELPQ